MFNIHHWRKYRIKKGGSLAQLTSIRSQMILFVGLKIELKQKTKIDRKMKIRSGVAESHCTNKVPTSAVC